VKAACITSLVSAVMSLIAVLEIPPVDSAQNAVQVQIVKDAKENKK
jgi:hypothetical protein